MSQAAYNVSLQKCVGARWEGGGDIGGILVSRTILNF